MYDPDELAHLVGPDLVGYVGQVIGEHSAIYQDNALQDEVNRMCLADSRLFLTGLNLAYTDRASMAASVEVRVPFVDPVVARAAFSIPGREKIKRRQSLAKQAAAEARVPHAIVYRPKASFQRAAAWVRQTCASSSTTCCRGRAHQTGVIRAAAQAHRRRAGLPRGLRLVICSLVARTVVPGTSCPWVAT
jgi:asparagine synthase (glutamine-hydrolysing)